MMGKEHGTGTRDELYDLISVLYHILQGAETYLQYIEDAEQTGDNELAQFFREIQQQDRQRADRAKELLRQRINQSKSR
ncbi:MAG TPA: hypothetical protein VNM22_01915 [Candidatus Limnocylindrales bacterium]|nr:hypothetical protein [Candidatus Limnocylindrales bacterium]